MLNGPLLVTERLSLRPPAAEDFEGFATMCAEEDPMRFIGGACPRASAWRLWCTLAGAWHIRGFSMFSVIERDTGERSWLPRAPRSQSEWGTTWQIAGLFGRESTREAKLAFARGELVTTGIPPGTRALRLFVVLRSVEPGSTESRVVRELVTFSPSELSTP